MSLPKQKAHLKDSSTLQVGAKLEYNGTTYRIDHLDDPAVGDLVIIKPEKYDAFNRMLRDNDIIYNSDIPDIITNIKYNGRYLHLNRINSYNNGLLVSAFYKLTPIIEHKKRNYAKFISLLKDL